MLYIIRNGRALQHVLHHIGVFLKYTKYNNLN